MDFADAQRFATYHNSTCRLSPKGGGTELYVVDVPRHSVRSLQAALASPDKQQMITNLVGIAMRSLPVHVVPGAVV